MGGGGTTVTDDIPDYIEDWHKRLLAGTSHFYSSIDFMAQQQNTIIGYHAGGYPMQEHPFYKTDNTKSDYDAWRANSAYNPDEHFQELTDLRDNLLLEQLTISNLNDYGEKARSNVYDTLRLFKNQFADVADADTVLTDFNAVVDGLKTKTSELISSLYVDSDTLMDAAVAKAKEQFSDLIDTFFDDTFFDTLEYEAERELQKSANKFVQGAIAGNYFNTSFYVIGMADIYGQHLQALNKMKTDVRLNLINSLIEKTIAMYFEKDRHKTEVFMNSFNQLLVQELNSSLAYKQQKESYKHLAVQGIMTENQKLWETAWKLYLTEIDVEKARLSAKSKERSDVISQKLAEITFPITLGKELGTLYQAIQGTQLNATYIPKSSDFQNLMSTLGSVAQTASLIT